MTGGLDVTQVGDDVGRTVRLWLRHRGVERLRLEPQDGRILLCFEAPSLEELDECVAHIQSVYEPMDLRPVLWDEDLRRFRDATEVIAALGVAESAGEGPASGDEFHWGRDELSGDHRRPDYDVAGE